MLNIPRVDCKMNERIQTSIVFIMEHLTLQKIKAAIEKSGSSGTSTLKYLENFTNPYVKVIVVCKICNKEQSLQYQRNWKPHYLTHVSDEEKPHKCVFCGKSFVTTTNLKTHLKTHKKEKQLKFEPK